MSISIDEINSIYGLTGVNGLTQSKMQNSTTAENEKKATDGDSYISTISMMDATKAIPSENYNDLGRMIKTASKAEANTSATEYSAVDNTNTSATEYSAVDNTNISATEYGTIDNTNTNVTDNSNTAEASNLSGVSGGGGGSSDADEDSEKTVTELVTINGQIYLQTTTTDADGNTTVTKVPIDSAVENNTIR